MTRQFDVILERDEEGFYVASVPQIPGCHTQVQSLDELTARIREAIGLCLEVEEVSETKIGVHRHSADHDCSMNRKPRITGSEILTALKQSRFCDQTSLG